MIKVKNDLYGKVESFENQRIKEAEVKDSKKSGRTEQGSDKVTLSEQARELAKAIKVAQDDEGIRADKVRELKQLIASGKYEPDAVDIAKKLIREDLDLWL